MRKNKNPALTAVATIGTVVGMTGVAHAMYDALAPSVGLYPPALAEALVAALFLESVVMVCARRARERADDAQAARLDVGVVLVAAVLSGLVSGIHVGWSTAGLFRFGVPLIAALVWLGDVINVLRDRRETDHERALRGVLAAVSARTHAEHADRWRGRRIKRAEAALMRAMSVYAALNGDRAELTRRLDEMHHRADLLSPLGPSPWRRIANPDPILPRTIRWPWDTTAPAALDLSSDPLLSTVKALVAADPVIGRPRLMSQLRKQGHKIGTERAEALLRAARTPALNGSGQGGTP